MARTVGTALAASAAVAVALATCARPSPPARQGGEPELRVGLVVGGQQARLGGQGETAAVERGQVAFRLGPGDAADLRPDGLAFTVGGSQARGRFETLTFVSLRPDRFVTVNGQAYRGVVEVFARNGVLTVVNRVGVDAYLQGVVVAEMGRRAPNETAALAAQAIVSRTYALQNRGRYGARGYDVGADIADQVYGGVGAELPQGNDAVQGTRGQVLAYRGQLVQSFFHSTCGYATAVPEEAFRSVRRTPYLRSVPDRKPGGGYYCDISPRFRWRVQWDADSLSRILRRTLPDQLGIERDLIDRVSEVRVQHTGASGRVTEVRVRVGSGEIPIFGPDLRAVLRTPQGTPLGSTAFQLQTTSGGSGGRTIVTAAGAGWGHGVGLCQWGAVGRARAGQSYRTIATSYFPGATIEKWY
ncbi:MAG: SpoIID/LytB domain-containing protein [Gemmatimonadetes bacterium]|nr:SpoIID/LytB domain-containing protein [Gemmatimonadota bacterium]